MKIAFVDTSSLRYTPLSPTEQPLGGTQSAACYLGMALASRGHAVSLYNASGSGEQVGGVKCLTIDLDNCKNLNDYDAVVVLSDPVGCILRSRGVASKLILWSHGSTDHSYSQKLKSKEEKKSWDYFVFVSDYQKQKFSAKFEISGKVLLNAMSPMMFRKSREFPNFMERNEDPVLAYASAPGRGLENLLISFPTIRKNLPGSRLRVFSSQNMYQIDSSKDQYSSYYELARNLAGVEYFGGVSQSRLADELTRCDIWAYPTIFEETSCIVMMEAAAAGCLLLASDYGALGETGGPYARRVKLLNLRGAWCGRFAQAVSDEVGRLRRHPEQAARFLENQSAWFRENYNWDKRASEWEAWLGEEVLVR